MMELRKYNGNIKEKFFLYYEEVNKDLFNIFNISIVSKKSRKSELKCNDCGNIFSITSSSLSRYRKFNCNPCPICDCKRSSSILENNLYSFVQLNYNGLIIKNSRAIIKPLELDIYFPELKLAIEFNGDYWHANPKLYNENCIMKFRRCTLSAGEIWERDKFKKNLCEEKLIKLITIWEYDWVNNRSYITDLLKKELHIITDKEPSYIDYNWSYVKKDKELKYFNSLSEENKKEYIKYKNYNSHKFINIGIDKYIIDLTSFLDKNYEDIPLTQRLWHVKNNNFTIQICKICGKPVKWRNLYKTYCQSCSGINNRQYANKISNLNRQNDFINKIKSYLFEHEIEYISNFSDGNGRKVYNMKCDKCDKTFNYKASKINYYFNKDKSICDCSTVTTTP